MASAPVTRDLMFEEYGYFRAKAPIGSSMAIGIEIERVGDAVALRQIKSDFDVSARRILIPIRVLHAALAMIEDVSKVEMP